MSSPVDAIPIGCNAKIVIKHKFPEEHSDPNVKEFLAASDEVRAFLSKLGPTLFSMVTNDIKGNIDKLIDYLEKNPDCTTLGDVLRKEKLTFGDSLNIKEKFATDAILWLTRALDFVLLFLSLWIQDNSSGVKADDLSKYFQTSYEMTLKPHHSWIVQKVVNVILSAAPTRTAILSSLKGSDESSPENSITDEEVFSDLEIHVRLLRANIDSVRSLYESVQYPWK
jgi:hypothetical protein